MVAVYIIWNDEEEEEEKRGEREAVISRWADGGSRWRTENKTKIRSRNKIRSRLSDLWYCVTSRRKSEAYAKKSARVLRRKNLRHIFARVKTERATICCSVSDNVHRACARVYVCERWIITYVSSNHEMRKRRIALSRCVS